MSQFFKLMILALLFASSAQAFENKKINQELATFKARLKTETSLEKRIAFLQAFNRTLHIELNSMPLDQTEKGRQEFASLNELYANTSSIRINPKSREKTCLSTKSQLLSENETTEKNPRPATAEALKILALICH